MEERCVVQSSVSRLCCAVRIRSLLLFLSTDWSANELQVKGICAFCTKSDKLQIALRILGLKNNSVAEACFQIALASCKNIGGCSTENIFFL